MTITWACRIFFIQTEAVCGVAALKLNHKMGICSSLMYTTLKQAERQYKLLLLLYQLILHFSLTWIAAFFY